MQSRAPEVDELMHFPFAFTLLTQIARRARRTTEGFNPHGLRTGEALIGDHTSIGASQQNYRTAKKRLDEWGFASFRPTTKGTIARLLDTRVYDINIGASPNEQANNQPNNPTTSQLPSPVTTNKEDNNGEQVKRYRLLKTHIGWNTQPQGNEK
jgi:hypothetical protein